MAVSKNDGSWASHVLGVDTTKGYTHSFSPDYTAVPVDGKWHHVTWVNGRTFVDGKKVGRGRHWWRRHRYTRWVAPILAYLAAGVVLALVLHG